MSYHEGKTYNPLEVLYHTQINGPQRFVIKPHDHSGFIAMAVTWLMLFPIFWIIYAKSTDVRNRSAKDDWRTGWAVAISSTRCLTVALFIADSALLFKMCGLISGIYADLITPEQLVEGSKLVPPWNCIWALCIGGGRLQSMLMAHRLQALAPRGVVPKWLKWSLWMTTASIVAWCAVFIVVVVVGLDQPILKDNKVFWPEPVTPNIEVDKLILSALDIVGEFLQLALTLMLYAKLMSAGRTKLFNQLVIGPLLRIFVIVVGIWHTAELAYASSPQNMANITWAGTNAGVASELRICVSIVAANATWVVPYCAYSSRLQRRQAAVVERYIYNQRCRELQAGLPTSKPGRNSATTLSTESEVVYEKNKNSSNTLTAGEAKPPGSSHSATSGNSRNTGRDHRGFPEPGIGINGPCAEQPVKATDNDKSSIAERPASLLGVKSRSCPYSSAPKEHSNNASLDHNLSSSCPPSRGRANSASTAEDSLDRDNKAQIPRPIKEQFLEHAEHISGCKIKPAGTYAKHPAVYPWQAKQRALGLPIGPAPKAKSAEDLNAGDNSSHASTSQVALPFEPVVVITPYNRPESIDTEAFFGTGSSTRSSYQDQVIEEIRADADEIKISSEEIYFPKNPAVYPWVMRKSYRS